MINEERKQNMLTALRSHTITSVRTNHRPRLPIVISSENEFIKNFRQDNVFIEENGVIEKPKILTNNIGSIYKDPSKDEKIVLLEHVIAESWVKKCNLIPMDHFHYNDKWYMHKFSADEPQYTFGIIKVENMPYNSFDGKRNIKSFICSMHDLMYNEYCEPFMVFVNRKFVSWDYINVVFDCDDTYLLLYGNEYNWYNLKDAEIHIVILPFKVGFIGYESMDHFNMMYEITKSYIQCSLRVVNDKIMITVPSIDEVYEYRGMVYNIGGWLYTQLKYYKLGILNSEKINKLKRIDISKITKDSSGNVISSITTKFNALDKDSYDIDIYNKISFGTKDEYKSKAIFRFTNSGILKDNGNSTIALFDDTTTFYEYYSSDKYIYHTENRIDNTLFRENYMVFKDGLFFPDCEIKSSVLNITCIDNPNKIKHNVKIFYHKPIEHIINHIDHFNNSRAAELALQSIKNNNKTPSSIDYDRINYFRKCLESLNYKYEDYLLYSENCTNAMDEIIKYDPTLLNSLYNKNIDSTIITGKEANETLVLKYSYEDRRGLKIPRHKYENHESYVLVFEDGELIEEYCNMIGYPNFFFIPMNRDFNDSSRIELLWFNKVDNNEIIFNITQNMIDNMQSLNTKWKKCNIFNQFIKPEDLKIFTRYPEEILIYKDLIAESDNIAFNISYRDDNNDLYLISDVVESDLNNTDKASEYIAVSSRKFIYQRLYIDQKAYRIVIDKRFRYCDNQKQYMLFINGRRMDDDSFLITIPKYNRPFWGMYLYTAKYVNPSDRIELFYVPEELVDINFNKKYTIDTDGYIRFNKTELDVPFDSNLYLYFINGKKIPNTDITPVDSYTIRINKDTLSTNDIVINPIYTDIIPEVQQYMKNPYKLSAYDNIIRTIKSTQTLGYQEIDNLFNIFVKISNTEINKTRVNVGRIAIINEIVRDFWVTSGYPYNELPFIYDYQMDDYIPIDRNNNAIIPALDATQFLNIIKNEIHLLYFEHDPVSEYYEIGSSINGMTFSWDYSKNMYTEIELLSQKMSYKSISDNNTTDIDININDRTWKFNKIISQDIDFNFTANRGFQIIERDTNIKFVNGIYYGNIDEDSLQHYIYDKDYEWINEIMALNPKNGVIPSYEYQKSESLETTALIYEDYNNIVKDFGYEIINVADPSIHKLDTTPSDGITLPDDDTSFVEFKGSNDLQYMLSRLNANIQLSPELILNDYIIGNNNYFVYACPKRLACSKNGHILIEFIMPDPKSDDIKANCRDDKTTPIYTTGNWSIIDHNLLEPIEEMKMIYLGEFSYTNPSGYTEIYCAWRSNGFFTRLFEDYGFHIEVRYKDNSVEYNDNLNHIIKPLNELEYTNNSIDNVNARNMNYSINNLEIGPDTTANFDNQDMIESTTNKPASTNNIVFLDDLNL